MNANSVILLEDDQTEPFSPYVNPGPRGRQTWLHFFLLQPDQRPFRIFIFILTSMVFIISMITHISSVFNSIFSDNIQ